MVLYTINSLAKYVELMERIGSNATTKWFRGQSVCDYRLSPSALRSVYAIEDQKGNKISPPVLEDTCSGSSNLGAFLPVDQMVAEFREKAEQFLEYGASTNIEWECIAQHYGIPTRVLDWTTNAINALFFAVEDCSVGQTKDNDIKNFFDLHGFGSGGGAVFVINPLEINKITVPIKDFDKNLKVLDAIEDTKVLETCLHGYYPPVCFSGFNKEKRISRQAGNFSSQGILLQPMDFISSLQEKIIKIFIPYSAYESIRHQLGGLGITHDTMYVEDDEKDKIAKKIAGDTIKKFNDRFSNPNLLNK